MTSKAFAICFLLWWLVSPALAATYHVAREAPGASDANDGLSATYIGGLQGPWRTITHAGQTAVAGDEVLCYSGDYRDEDSGWGVGFIPLAQSGTESAPIQFGAAPDQTPVIHTFLVHGRSWIEIEGFTCTARDFTLPPNWQDMPATVIDDPTVVIDPNEPWVTRELKVRQKYATYMTMFDFFTSVYTNAVDVKGSHHITISHNQIQLYTFGVQVRATSSHIVVEDNFITHCLDGVFTWQPSPSMTDSEVRGNTIQQCFNSGMQIREDCQRVIVEDNDIQFCGTSHISMLQGCEDSTIRRNFGRDGGFYTEVMEHPGSTAINVHTSRGGIVVEQNFAAFQVDPTYVDGNGFIADLMLDGAGVLFRNNIAYRNVGSGLRTVDSPNCVIVNNTFVENGFLMPDPRRGAGVYLSRDPDVDQTIANNIFYDNHPAGIKSYYLMDDQLLIDHNLYFAPSGVPHIWDGWNFDENVYATIAEVQQFTGWETHGQEDDPQFSNLAGADFRHAAGSAAEDTGVHRADVPDDYDGTLRPIGPAYDLGAFEGAVPVAVPNPEAIPPAAPALHASPNPTRSSCRLVIAARNGPPGQLRLVDATGRVVFRGTPSLYERGLRIVEWDGTGLDGRPVPQGVYYADWQNGLEAAAIKVAIIR